MEAHCPCGCDFVVEADEAGRERMEQHVRWIHLPALAFALALMQARAVTALPPQRTMEMHGQLEPGGNPEPEEDDER